MNESIRCIIVDDEPMAREILESYVKKTPSLLLLKSCKNVKEAIEFCSKNTVNLIFLDIEMSEISGITFAKIIDKKVKIIFTTAYREYAVEGFDVEAIDYLLKPFPFSRFQQAINKYIGQSIPQFPEQKSKFEPSESSNFIFVRSDRKMIKVDFEKVVLIESLSDYVKIHFADVTTLVTRETISNMEAKLPKANFIRIHRSFIVAIDKIISYTNEHIQIEKRELPISRTYKDFVIEQLNGLQ